ncbi:hypothetical protein P8935_14200 [Telmatobacter sp. DSM 110680]|uniref:Uncharacterized protein n=1 Tax=Telmatobacter sp. DSM 110680 TaxID=3036704 RepID=A0AAU7DEZ5_9BACT
MTLSYRIFVPALAKPFYLLGKGRIGSWDPALFGMLVAASILSASTAIAVIAIGIRNKFSYTTSLVGGMLFLFNFSVSNWNLSGYVDSGEAFFLAMVIWSLLSERWFLLPVWAIPGSLSKDTFAPFAFLFAVIWWANDRPFRASRAIWIGGLGVLSCMAVLVSLNPPHGLFFGGLSYSLEMRRYHDVGFLKALLRCLTAREFWFVFVWLMPLGLVRIHRMDRRWIWATSGAFFLAMIFGAYNDALGNTARAFFNIAGPLLSLAAADLLTMPKP